MEDIQGLSQMRRLLRAVLTEVALEYTGWPLGLSINTRSTTFQGFIRIKLETRRDSSLYSIRTYDSSEHWLIHPHGIPLLVGLGSVVCGSAKLNAKKGDNWMIASSTPSLFGDIVLERFLLLLVDPSAHNIEDGSWLILADGIDEIDRRTIHSIEIQPLYSRGDTSKEDVIVAF
jgi:hypothetical protein